MKTALAGLALALVCTAGFVAVIWIAFTQVQPGLTP